MSLRPLRLAATAAVAALALNPHAAEAGSSTTTFNVTVTITSQCLVSNASTLAFGSSGLLSAAVNASSTFSVTCTNTTPYTVALGNGSNASGTQRRMLGGVTDTEYVSYNLYSNSTMTTAWGNGVTVSGTGNGTAQTLTVYGQIPAQNTPSPGTNYTDSVTITVSY
ncbi:MAG TPA: spore coat U domain-containing protein [Methylocystis sp.]|nr:spore coat U domain-containing protein [Methylocystis sp.]